MAQPSEPDSGRALYIGACRIDLIRRAGTARLLSDAQLTRTVARALEAAGAPTPASVTIVLSDDEELRDLNRTHLDRDEPTDVLSFPMLLPEAYPPHPGAAHASAGPGASARPPAQPSAESPGRTHIGDVAISVERAIDQAHAGRGGQTGDIRWSPSDELRLLVTHGVLHLCGWDHAEPEEEAAMRALEQRLLAEGR
ncbi:MAG TPA: rRNA maturation RNase YbeY [Candidatus Limnocylindrales bacterium]